MQVEEQLAACFNEWMRRFTDEPNAFEQQWKLIIAFIDDEKAGQAPAYGRACAVYLQELARDLGFAQPSDEPGVRNR